MNVFLDSSVVLRVLFGEPNVLKQWSKLGSATVARILLLEVARVIDRKRISDNLSGEQVADLVEAFSRIHQRLNVVEQTDVIWTIASRPFPTLIRSIDSIHLATAMTLRDASKTELIFATHDVQQGHCARALGFQVIGL